VGGLVLEVRHFFHEFDMTYIKHCCIADISSAPAPAFALYDRGTGCPDLSVILLISPMQMPG
jgi:hypothetical protein